MWALTVLQPYAWMMIHGSKDIENRSWVNAILNHLITRGEPFAVHAGLSMTRVYYREAVEFAKAQDPELVVPRIDELVLGALLGTVVPTQIYRPEDWTPDRRWHMPDQYGWQLEDRTTLPRYVPAKGKQGFWTVDDALLGRGV